MTDPAESTSATASNLESMPTTSKPYWMLAIASAVCSFSGLLCWDLLPVWNSASRRDEIRALVRPGESWDLAEKQLRENGFNIPYNPDFTVKLIQVTTRESRTAPWLSGQAYKFLPAYRYRIARYREEYLFDEYMRVMLDKSGNVKYVF